MNISSIRILVVSLFFLILVAAFFSAAETGMMAINRYRLRHLARKKNRPARRVSELLERPDRLLGVILLGSNIVSITASALVTVLALHLFGDIGVVLGTVLLTFILLIFGEIAPKTLATIYPERVAFTSSLPLKILLKIAYPIVWCVNMIANGLLRLVGVKVGHRGLDVLSREELRTVVGEAAGKIPSSHRDMLLSILDLEKIAVQDIMVPRNDIIGIDIENDWQTILQQLMSSQHARVPIYRENIDQIVGILHLRRALNLIADNRLDKNSLLEIIVPPYFVPEGTALNVQLINFRQHKMRSALVVDEYGDILGLVTLEDILEEIIGEFTTSLVAPSKNIQLQRDDSYLIDGSVSIRDLNRTLDWELPISGPITLSGLIVEYLETLPQIDLCLRIAGYPMEILAIEENTVKTAQIWPKLRRNFAAPNE
jgi:Mg2+/Co2+ transporter CorB